jgi:hypothetical protein
MNTEQFFIQHCESLFEAMEEAGQEVANGLNLDLNTKELLQDGRKELKIFIENDLKVDFLFSEDADEITPTLKTINEALLLVGFMQMLGL